MSGLSVVFSVGSLPGMPPEIEGPSFLLDVGVTAVAIIHTENAYAQGQISNVNRLASDITGGLGAIPSKFGLGLSIINFLITMSGYPR